MIYCMYTGLSGDEVCNNEGTILITASCTNGCWTDKKVYACEEHTAKVRGEEKHTKSACGKCQGDVKLERMTSV